MTNRIPFDLERFLAGDEAVCRNNSLEVVDFKYWKNAKGKKLQVQVKDEDGDLYFNFVDDKGIVSSVSDSGFDLFMKPRKKTLWIAVSKKKYDDNHLVLPAFSSKKKLLNYFHKENCIDDSFKIIQIEIEV